MPINWIVCDNSWSLHIYMAFPEFITPQSLVQLFVLDMMHRSHSSVTNNRQWQCFVLVSTSNITFMHMHIAYWKIFMLTIIITLLKVKDSIMDERNVTLFSFLNKLLWSNCVEYFVVLKREEEFADGCKMLLLLWLRLRQFYLQSCNWSKQWSLPIKLVVWTPLLWKPACDTFSQTWEKKIWFWAENLDFCSIMAPIFQGLPSHALMLD